MKQTLEYINLSALVHHVTRDGNEQRDLIDALSHSDVCFGTNAYSLIELSYIGQAWIENGFDEYAEIITKVFGATTLVNLEG